MNIKESWINIFGVPVAMATRTQVVSWCEQRLKLNQRTHVVTANPEILLRARRDGKFKKIILEADLITPDGAGVCWAAVFFGKSEHARDVSVILKIFFNTLLKKIFGKGVNNIFPERVSGSDLLWDMMKIAETNDAKVFLLGGKKHTAQRAAHHINGLYPRLKLFYFLPDHVATPYSCYELYNLLAKVRPDIILVAYGSPKQEEWINQNLYLFSSIKIAMGVGGALDFIAGNTLRAPLRLQNHALEWFWRLYKRPSRIVRVLRAIGLFPAMILLSRLKKHYANKFRN